MESTQYFTPAVSSSSTMARVVFLPSSSKVPAQPTQNRYSVSAKLVMSSPKTGTVRPSRRASSIQVTRSESLRPHGLPFASRFLNIPVSSEGKSDSARTWNRRRLATWSMCSISTGHCSTQAPQLVQLQSSSPVTAVPTSFSTSTPSYMVLALSIAVSRTSVMNFLGLSGLLVFQAGHCSWQRPHSVQVAASRSMVHGTSWAVPTPTVSSRSMVGSLPNAGAPSGLRCRKILKNARKRCHATPQCSWLPTTSSHTMPVSSLIRAKMLTNTGLAGRILASCMVRKSVHT